MAFLELGIYLTKITSSYRFRLITQVYRGWLKKNDKVLDIGCGNGIISKLLKDHFSVDMTCADVKNYLIHNLPFRKLKGNKLPFKDQTFSVVTLNDVLHHISPSQQENVILESVRVGRKLLIFEAEPTISGSIADTMLNKYHYGDLNIPLTFKTADEWKQTFKKMNLVVKAVKLNKPFWYPFSHIAFEVRKV